MADNPQLPATKPQPNDFEQQAAGVSTGLIAEFVDFLSSDAPLTDTWRIQGSGEFSENIPVLQANGHMESTEVRRTCEPECSDSGSAVLQTQLLSCRRCRQ